MLVWNTKVVTPCLSIYFQHLLSHMPNTDFKNDPEKLESLLPWSADLPEDCRLPADSAKNTQED
jgi:hypothetical protein